MVKCALPSISEGEGGCEVWRLHRDISPQFIHHAAECDLALYCVLWTGDIHALPNRHKLLASHHLNLEHTVVVITVALTVRWHS